MIDKPFGSFLPNRYQEFFDKVQERIDPQCSPNMGEEELLDALSRLSKFYWDREPSAMEKRIKRLEEIVEQKHESLMWAMSMVKSLTRESGGALWADGLELVGAIVGYRKAQEASGPLCGKHECMKAGIYVVHGSLKYHTCPDHLAEIEAATARE